MRLIKPVGGHASYQTGIHGIKDEHTFSEPEFIGIFPSVKQLLGQPLVAHSGFDKQVLNALSEHFNLNLDLNHTDSCKVAKNKLPELENHQLKTLARHFSLPEFKHHDPEEDAIACANIFIKLNNLEIREVPQNENEEVSDFRRLVENILSDDEVDYKESYGIWYWLEDHSAFARQYPNLLPKIKKVLADNYLDAREAAQVKTILKDILKNL